jgi:hypothetical protein
MAAALGAGCAGTATSNARVAPTTTTKQPESVPLVLETGIPLRVPTARLIAGTDGREIAQTGFLYTSDWTTRRHVDHPPSSPRSRWPEPLTIVDPDAAIVAIDTTALPDWVVIKTYATVAGQGRTPDAPPIEEIDCMRFVEPKCSFTTSDAGLRIRYDARKVFAGSYIVVFGIWHVPVADQRPGSLTPGEVVASWLFRFVSPSDQEASRS